MNKTLTIDLSWLLLPFTLVFTVLSTTFGLAFKALFGLFLFTGIGYLILKATKSLGYDYSVGKASWNDEYLQMKITKRPRWATAYFGGRRRRYTVVGGPDNFYLKRSGQKAEKQQLMRGFYVRCALDRMPQQPQPIFVNAPLQVVPVPQSAPQPQYAPQPYTPYLGGGTITYGSSVRH